MGLSQCQSLPTYVVRTTRNNNVGILLCLLSKDIKSLLQSGFRILFTYNNNTNNFYFAFPSVLNIILHYYSWYHESTFGFHFFFFFVFSFFFMSRLAIRSSDCHIWDLSPVPRVPRVKAC